MDNLISVLVGLFRANIQLKYSPRVLNTICNDRVFPLKWG